MIDLVRASRARCLLAQATTTVVAGLLLAAIVPVAASPAPGFDGLLVRLSAAALAVCTAWAWVLCSLVVHEARSRAPVASRRRGVPPHLRRLVLRACGLALAGATATTASPAAATPESLQQGTVVGGPTQDPLAGLPLPDRPLGGRASHRRAEVRVAVGDSLWTIAERHLTSAGHRPSDADVARYWPLVHEANRAVIGTDPDRLRAGQRLRLPARPDPA